MFFDEYTTTNDKVFYSLIGALLTALVISILYAVFILTPARNLEIDRFTERCEALDGVYVKNARRVGKTTYTSYLCLRKDVVLEVMQ